MRAAGDITSASYVYSELVPAHLYEDVLFGHRVER